MQLADLRSRVDDALVTAVHNAVQRLVTAAPTLAGPAGLLKQASAGGKRIRPSLVLAGHRLVAGGDEPVMGPALATELLHLCALLHDDVIDGAATRRGQPAFHAAAAAAHRANGWRGDPSAHGRAAAILFGDLAFVLADELFFDGELAPDLLVAGHRVFTVMREEVMRGQYLDVEAAARGATSIEEALAIALHKSGRYTITRPVEIGATLAGAPPPVLAALGAWADPLGVAFQLTDDLLGVFGESDRTGKDITSDLREGKRTVLVAEAMARLTPSDAGRLDKLLGRHDLADDELAWMRETIASSGARAAVVERVSRLVDQASAALDDVAALDVDASGMALLAELTGLVADRDH